MIVSQLLANLIPAGSHRLPALVQVSSQEAPCCPATISCEYEILAIAG